MSWTDELFHVFENNIGKDDEQPLLLPICHTTTNVQVEVTLKDDGQFVGAARILDKKDAVTVIPVTEDSGTRSNGNFPHPFADKLIYVGGDYALYAPKDANKAPACYEKYIGQLQAWAKSEYSHPAVRAVYQYLSKGTLLSDLIKEGVLILDDKTGKIKDESLFGTKQWAFFVRFYILYSDFLSLENRTWKDKTLHQSYVEYSASLAGEKQLCYATGEMVPCTYKHPAKIRNSGDKAKILSSNDEDGFTYRGRFDNKTQAFSVGYVYSQKVHNALKWLIEKQGYKSNRLGNWNNKDGNGSAVIIMWESNLKKLPDLFMSSGQFSGEDPDDVKMDPNEELDLDALYSETMTQSSIADTMPKYRKFIRDAIYGYQKTLEPSSKSMLLILDGASDKKGRIAVSLYEEMRSSELLLHIQEWHETTAWFKYNWKIKQNEISSFSLYEIVRYAYGVEQKESIVCDFDKNRSMFVRLIPCVIQGRPVPPDIVANIIRKASNPMAYDKRYNWERVLGAACGMLRKTKIDEQKKWGKKGEDVMALNCSRKDRDYLYGRLLAICDFAESSTFEKGSERTS